MAELAALAETAGSEVLDAIFQRRRQPDPATYIGRGKVDGLREIVRATGADTVICDGELAPSQLRNLEDQVKVKVVDRTALILDIFAQHAKSREGQAQVELAQLNYMKPRLRGWGGNLSRQAGGRAAGGEGIGGRGPGETKIETDRRRINTKIAKLRRELAAHEGHPRHQAPGAPAPPHPERRDRRLHQRRQVLLLNRLTGAGVLVEDALFATLDPTTRRTTTSDGRVYTLSDTVGFVRHLPHQLVEAFRSHAGGGRRLRPDPARRRRLARRPRGPDRRGARGVRRDRRRQGARDRRRQQGRRRRPDGARPAAAARAALGRGQRQDRRGHRRGARAARGRPAAARASSSRRCVPYARGDLVDRLHQHGEIASLEHTGDGTVVRGRAHADLAGELAAYPV